MNPCPACAEKRLHTAADWTYHPLAGHGYNGTSWTHPDLESGAASLEQISGEVVLAAAPLAGSELKRSDDTRTD